MSRLIDADKLWKALDVAGLFNDRQDRHIAQGVVEEQPTVDAVPVGCGHWEAFSREQFMGLDEMGNPKYRDGKVYCCSECGRKSIIKTKYCPDCGHYMR